MFKLKTVKQRLQEEQQKNEALNAQLAELTDALVELAEITAENGTESEV